MKMILDNLTEAVNGINAKLLSSATLTEIEREKLLTDRERCEWLINMFPNQEVVLGNIKKFLEKYNKQNDKE